MRNPLLRSAVGRARGLMGCLVCSILLLGCSPKFDWREVRGTSDPYVVMFPAKPDTHAREIDLAGTHVTMTMTGTQIDGVTFAVGTVALPDATQAQQALPSMKTALVRNIRGTVTTEKTSSPSPGATMIELEARGPLDPGERVLLARFVAKDRHAYQLLVVGPADALSREAAETFLTSFQLPG